MCADIPERSIRSEAAYTFIPHAFHKRLGDALCLYDAAMCELRVCELDAADYLRESTGGHDNQIKLSILYDDTVRAAREAFLVLSHMHKNRKLLPLALPKIQDAVLGATGRRVSPKAFIDENYLGNQMSVVRNTLLGITEALNTAIIPEYWEHRAQTPNRGDAYLTLFRQAGPLKANDFHDWAEYNFFHATGLPLALYSRSEALDAYMFKRLNSPYYLGQVLEDVRTGALGSIAPGLTVIPPSGPDTEPVLPSDKPAVSMEHVFFTPSPRASVVDLSRREPRRFGRITFSP